MKSCKHKSFTDHTTGRGAGDRLMWRCSFCGLVGSWQRGWGYWGNLECKRCWTADIESVHCPSGACKSAFIKKHQPTREDVL